MAQLVEAVRNDGGRQLILLAPPAAHFDERLADYAARVNGRLRAYRAELRELAGRHPDVYMGPDLGELLDPDVHLPKKGAHMTGAGHRVVGERLARFIRALPPPPDRTDDGEAPP